MVLNQSFPRVAIQDKRLRSAAHLLALAGIYDLPGIDGFPVNLLFQNLSVFADQEVDAARRFVFVDVNAVLASDVSSPIAQQRESDSDQGPQSCYADIVRGHSY